MKGFVLRIVFLALNCSMVFCYPTTTTSSVISEKGKNVSDDEYTIIIGDDNDGHNRSTSTGATATLKFLRKFGYLESLESGSSETLYSKETVSGAVRLMQRFGGLPETGEIDADTLSLVTKPRCGVPDVAAHLRTKRFAFGSKGWNKRRLTYKIENWSPKLTEESVRKDMDKAFDIWARYAHLRFVNWTSDSNNRRADISISFGRGYHGDTYPFDGPGGTLAHAFYPQNNDGIGGDVHFDEDEKWFSNSDDKSQNGISFLAVATHELGHSLGLAHSHIPGSVMFPYYQSRDSLSEPQLDYDDIMALYELYILRSISDGEDHTPETTSSNPKPESTTEVLRPESTASPSPTVSTTFKPATTASGTHDHDGTTTQSSSTTTKHTHEDLLPNLCKDGFDTVSFIRNEIFVFQGMYMWRFCSQGQEALGGYPVLASRLFPLLKNVAKIDAAFERESDGKIVFISGPLYWIFDGTSEGNSGPHRLTDFGLPNDLDSVDTAFVWGKNKMTYFFKDELYWKYNETSQQMGAGYPRNIEMWRGVPAQLTSALRYKDGRTYFFKNDEFWRFDDTVVHTEDGFPMQTSGTWFNC